MKLTFAFLGAGALALMSGAAAGSAVNTDPVSRADSAAPSFAAGHPQPAVNREVARGPDHYPLETPRGVVPISELSWYGVQRSRAHLWRDDAYSMAQRGADGAQRAWERTMQAGRSAARIGLGEVQQAVIEVQPARAEPLQNVDLAKTRQGSRMIDVAAELARYR